MIVFDNFEHGMRIAQGAGHIFNPIGMTVIANVRDDQLLGGVLFTDYVRHQSIRLHSAAWSRHWLTKDMLYVLSDYPFNQLRVKRLFGFVPETNEHALRFNRKLGFKQVEGPPIWGMFRHDVACVVMRLDREDCRFLSLQPRSASIGGRALGQ